MCSDNECVRRNVMGEARAEVNLTRSSVTQGHPCEILDGIPHRD